MKNYSSSKYRARPARPSHKEKAAHDKKNKVLDWLHEISNIKLVREALKTDANRPWFEALKSQAEGMTYPTRKPQNFTDLDVYEAIKGSFHGQPEECWLWDFWSQLGERTPQSA